MACRVLTGIKPTGAIHLGNYAGAIRPALARSLESGVESFFFLADYHALIDCRDPRQLAEHSAHVAAAWLAMGLDPDRCLFYRQSDVPEIMEMNWILNCMAAKGLLNRAHAYKAQLERNLERDCDPDKGISMALYCYPVLMAADILMFKADEVPVGTDQKQHVEMARDIAQRFNSHYGDLLVIPRAVSVEGQTIAGLDGRKMSKSYGNTIPLFVGRDELRKLIMKIKTNSQLPAEPKEYSQCSLYSIFKAFASDGQTRELAGLYRQGIAWSQVKQRLFELLDAELAEPRRKYRELRENNRYIAATLAQGAERARQRATPYLKQLRVATGIGLNP